MSCLTSHAVAASRPTPLNGAVAPASSPRAAPMMISAAARMKVSWLERGGDSKRLSSRRSAAMVRTRNASHHPATSAAGASSSHTSVPPTQHAAAIVRMTVNSAGCRTTMVTELKVRAMPASRKAPPANAGAPTMSATAPMADSVGRRVGPPSSDRHRAFETNHGSEKPTDHQGTVELGQGGHAARQRQPEPRKTHPQPGEE